jgi:hypothetical protein
MAIEGNIAWDYLTKNNRYRYTEFHEVVSVAIDGRKIFHEAIFRRKHPRMV